MRSHSEYDYYTDKDLATMKDALCVFLGKENMDRNFIQQTGSWKFGELQIGRRIYSVDERDFVCYGDEWYSYHRWKDIGKYRVSESYGFFPNSCRGTWKLTVATEDVFVWKNRTTHYKKMTDGQLDRITKTFVDAYVRAGKPGGADIDVLYSTIHDELRKRFKKLWFER